MSALHDQLAGYLAVRRALGYRLEREEKLLVRFLAYLDGRDIEQITVDAALAWANRHRFRALSDRLMDAMRENSAEKTISTKKGTIRYQEFYAKPVKPLFDEIDCALAEHYELTDEELDFVVNYDLKYRIGTDE